MENDIYMYIVAGLAIYGVIELIVKFFGSTPPTKEELLAELEEFHRSVIVDMAEKRFNEAPRPIKVSAVTIRELLHLLSELNLEGIDEVVDKAYDIVEDITDGEEIEGESLVIKVENTENN